MTTIQGGRAEAGNATTQVVLVTPVLVLLVMVVFQFALYQHASHVVTAAAQHGATAAQLEGGSVGAGQTEAARFIGRADRGLLRGSTIHVTRTPTGAHVVVEASVVSLVPGLSLSVRGTADGPAERFMGRTER